MPLVCKSVFRQNFARLSIAPTNEKQNACFHEDGGFDLAVPFPFLLEPAPQPWLGWRLGHGQIVSPGVHHGIGTSNPQIYCKFLEGIELVLNYNKKFARQQNQGETYIDQAGHVKAMLLRLRQIKQNEPVFTQIQQCGVNWASSAFEHYLMAGLDEAYAVALYSSSCDTQPLSTAHLQQLVAPLVCYRKARQGWSVSIGNPQFGVSAKKRAFHGCLAFCVQNLFCPWHGKRSLDKDAETGKVMQICLDELSESDSHQRLKKKVRAFQKGCTLPLISGLTVDVEFELVRWLQADKTFVSKSEQLVGHNRI